MSPETSTTLHFKLRIGDAELSVASTLPAERVPLASVLPAIQPIANAIVDAAVRPVVEAGAQVSCGAGCGACCRQPVPIAESEAERLVALLAAMPAPRRADIEARFRSAVEKLEASGLLDAMARFDELEDVDARQALGRAYFDLGIACPFLEAESCGIHPDRPLACREYLVTSPAAACASPTADDIDLIPIPMRPSVALFGIDERGGGRSHRALALVLALRFVADRDAGSSPRATGPEWLERWLGGLAGRSA